MKCADRMAQLVECARRGAEPRGDLKTHLAGCEKCAGRWESERRLTEQLRTMRARTADLTRADEQRDILLREFAELHRGRPARPWIFALGTATAVIAVLVAGHAAGRRAHDVPAAATAVYDDDAGAAAGDALSDDFIAVPYTPPLAQGELIRVIHTNLYPEALSRLGIDVGPEASGEIPADVEVGEDGIPRAVRLTEGTQ